MSDVIKLIKCLKHSAGAAKSKGKSVRSFERKKFAYPFRIISHPFDSFSDIKYEGMGSLLLANLLLVLYFVTNVLRYFCLGYIFNIEDSAQFNVLLELLYSVVLLSLWSVSNWAICTLMDGEGKFKEIWIASCYALTPRIIGQILVIILSNCLSLDEQVFLSLIDSVSILLTVTLVLLGMLVVHQYTLMKTILSSLLTIFGIITLMFICVLFFSVVQQMLGFINTVYTEILNKF